MRIVLFCGNGMGTDVVYSYIKNKYNLVGMVVDSPSTAKKKFIKRRIKKLGFFNVISQLSFIKFIVPLLKYESKKRVKQLHEEYDFKIESINNYENKISPVSINDNSVLEYVEKLYPDLIIVNGTRIIKKNIIDNIKATMINMHVGITPKYRGVHGGYWALANNDKENCGVTVHLIDKGIDTGGIIAQKSINITSKDNYCTYPILQVRAGLECHDEAIQQIENRNLKLIKNNLESKLHYHPTFFGYLYKRFFKGIK